MKLAIWVITTRSNIARKVLPNTAWYQIYHTVNVFILSLGYASDPSTSNYSKSLCSCLIPSYMMLQLKFLIHTMGCSFRKRILRKTINSWKQLIPWSNRIFSSHLDSELLQHSSESFWKLLKIISSSSWSKCKSTPRNFHLCAHFGTTYL